MSNKLRNYFILTLFFIFLFLVASKITCIVGVINLLPNLHPERFIQLLIDSNPQEWVPSTTIPSMLPARFDLYNNKHARSFTFLFANIHDPIQILNVVNISDHLLFYSEASDDLPLISQVNKHHLFHLFLLL